MIPPRSLLLLIVFIFLIGNINELATKVNPKYSLKGI